MHFPKKSIWNFYCQHGHVQEKLKTDGFTGDPLPQICQKLTICKLGAVKISRFFFGTKRSTVAIGFSCELMFTKNIRRIEVTQHLIPSVCACKRVYTTTHFEQKTNKFFTSTCHNQISPPTLACFKNDFNLAVP